MKITYEKKIKDSSSSCIRLFYRGSRSKMERFFFFSFFHSIQQFRIIRRNFLFYPSFSLGERANAQRESIGRKSRCQQTLNLNPFLSAERGSNRYRRSREPRIVNSSTPSPFSISRPSIPKNFIRYYSELHELLSPFRFSPPPSFLSSVRSPPFCSLPPPPPSLHPFRLCLRKFKFSVILHPGQNIPVYSGDKYTRQQSARFLSSFLPSFLPPAQGSGIP